MPLTSKGEKIMRNMKREYGEKEGERNFYASRNAGTIKGVDTFKVRGQPNMHRGSFSVDTSGFVRGGRR